METRSREKLAAFPFLIVAAAAVLRLLPHEPNMAPIGAMALFSGVYLKGKKAFFVPLAAMVMSDFFLGFHSTMGWVYGSFLLIVLLGRKFNGGITWKSVGLMSVSASVLFYLITNFGVWVSGTMYPKTVAGLVECYVMALPFFRNTLAGDLIYSGVFFGAVYISSRSLAWLGARARRDA